jgi:hypothetical protein
MAQSPEVQAKIQLLRQKSRDGTLTQDEMREAIILMREGRVAASATSAKAKSRKSSKASVNSDDLLNELDNL